MKNKKIWVIVLDCFVIIAALIAPSVAKWTLNTFDGGCYSLKMGLICPACGGTRCVYNFFSGNFIEAFSLNPAVFCGIIYVGILLIVININTVKETKPLKKLQQIMLHPAVITALMIVYVIVGCSRNFV